MFNFERFQHFVLCRNDSALWPLARANLGASPPSLVTRIKMCFHSVLLRVWAAVFARIYGLAIWLCGDWSEGE